MMKQSVRVLIHYTLRSLPEQTERKAYIDLWNGSLKAALRISEETSLQLSEVTEGFSFAYLKELFLSSMMRWIANGQHGTLEQTMLGQVNTLKQQMVSSAALEAAEPAEQPSLPIPYRRRIWIS